MEFSHEELLFIQTALISFTSAMDQKISNGVKLNDNTMVLRSAEHREEAMALREKISKFLSCPEPSP